MFPGRGSDQLYSILLWSSKMRTKNPTTTLWATWSLGALVRVALLDWYGGGEKLGSGLLKWGKEWVVMYKCELDNEKAECWRNDAFELWCWERLLRVPWTARRSNQSILKKINPEYSLEVMMLKLKLQYFGHLRRRANSLEKTLMLGKSEGRRRRGRQKIRWLASLTWIWTNSGRWWRTGKPGVL